MATVPRTQVWEDFPVDLGQLEVVEEPEEVYQAKITPPARFRAVIDGEVLRCAGKDGRPCGLLLSLALDELRTTLHLMEEWRTRHQTTARRVPVALHTLTLRCGNGHEERWAAEPADRLPETPLRTHDRYRPPAGVPPKCARTAPAPVARGEGTAPFRPTPGYVRPASRVREEYAELNAELNKLLAASDFQRPGQPPLRDDEI